ncbi:MAG: hypothetical protein JSW17_06285 [Candidatus Omnitrophota bacterium]|nr:MAG: hypothetical protein JSW17_06285 [Candidatus Omnitrophota bacterium]
MQIWAYTVASVGLVIGVSLLIAKQIRYGFWIIVVSMTIFLGGSLNVDKIFGVSISMNKLQDKIQRVDSKVENLEQLYKRVESRY